MTTPTVYEAFQALSPIAFKSVRNDIHFEILTGLASQIIGSTLWADGGIYAKALLIAHFRQSLGVNNGGRGQVTQETVGSLSRTYASMGDGPFNQTTWGSMYLQLRDALICHSPLFI